MPNLFSRSRTNSTPKKTPFDTAAYDEFGRINSRGSARGQAVPQLGTGKKDKKKDSKEKARPRAANSLVEHDAPEFAIPDGSFLPLNLDPPRYESNEDDPRHEPRPIHDYGYLSYGRHVILGLEQVARLVDVVGDELGTRGLTTPFIFSSLALDVSSNAVKRLIRAFLRTCGKPSSETEHQWREEARLAEPHELGMCLRWGLARVIRIVKGQEVRGLVAYENYIEWRDAEAALNYPETHFAAFLAPLDPLLRSILVGLLTLLTRFTAHSASSGHTPPTLSPLFGPLLFGLGPSTLPFHHAYMYYLRATTATEHLILSFIRWQDVPRAGAGVAALGLPTRLKAWIQGYPVMLPASGKQDVRPQPRRGARTVRVISVRRNVRMYSPDLVRSAASWAHRPRSAVMASVAGDRTFAGSKEWERIVPPTLKLPPRYSDVYRKRMDLPPNFHPDTGSGSSTSTISAPSLSSSTSTASSATSTLFDEHGILGPRAGEDRFRSLTDLKWGEFEVMGFGDLGADDKKLQFDLTESARAARAAKRATLTWQDFSSSGFTRSDAPLNATLQFSTPVTATVNSWPAHSAEITRKLKKAQKSLPTFGWDTEPVMGSEEVIEEAFVDVFCDLVYGGGWMDAERCVEIDRECNWALVEFKSLPISKTSTVSGTADPRTSMTLILFEEFVPLEYRQQLAASGTSRRRLPSLFGTSKPKQWKPAPTLNGRPYVIGHVPSSPSYREVEFEGLLRSNGSVTKIISLNRSPDAERDSPVPSNIATSGHTEAGAHLLGSTLRVDARTDSPTKRPQNRQERVASPIPGASPSINKRISRFRLPAGLPVSPGTSRKMGLPPAEYESVDFDARLASFSDEELGGAARSKQGRRRSKDDAWVDILVANNNRRMGGQDAEMRNGHGLQSRRSDPELASQEVSEVLAAVRGHLSTDDEDDNGMEPVNSVHRADEEQEDDTTTLEDSMFERAQSPPPERESALFGDDEDGEASLMPVRKKRPGYFDLHPERRPAQQDDYDLRSRFERYSLESDANSEDHTHGRSDPSALIPPMQLKDDAASSRQSYTSGEDGDFEPTPNPSFVHSSNIDISSSSGIRRLPHLSIETGMSPAITVSPPEHPTSTGSGTAKPTPSKTASLIEMYRERERSVTTPLPSSRLPVRSASLQAQPLGTSGTQPAAAPTVKPPTAAVPPSTAPETEESDVDSELLALEETEPNLPNRYIHGAPLHNVIEETEEED
ncbi:hypothetical protein AcW1_002909 [Taiwanofungus camphoratus]|nr:hypothetical protein AcV7_005682 [Antrodia cinnamomea]KAI0942226.1 hypothetical protein AcW1_002909 [Antrodia cinnamomea]